MGRPETPAGEAEWTLKQGPANHFVGIEAVGGWLYLTNRRLVFQSHNLNVRNHAWSADLAEMVEAAPVRTLGIMPNGLLVRTRSGPPQRFVVGGRREWAAAISRALASTDA